MRTAIRRTIIICLLGSFAGASPGSDADGKIGARLRMLLNRPGSEAVTLHKALGRCIDDNRWVKVFVEGESAESEVIEAGGIVDAVVGDVLTAKLPLRMIRSLARSGKIRKIRMASRVRLLNDLAVPTVGADRVAPDPAISRRGRDRRYHRFGDRPGSRRFSKSGWHDPHPLALGSERLRGKSSGRL